MIELRDVQKVVDEILRLGIERLAVEAGEIAAVVGPVGSGQAELIDLLLGRTRPTAGTVLLAGVDPAADRARLSRQVGVLFAKDSLYRRQSPRANLRFHCRLRGLARSRADEVLAQVGLGDCADVRVEKLPSGLARRLALGCALLHEPAVLLLIEPFARCDEATISLLRGLMRQQADAGVALLILAEDDANLASLCDRVHLLAQGRIVESYHPHDAQRAQLPFKIPVKLEARVALINPGDILYATAEEGRASLQTRQERLMTQFTLSELEERLARSGFFRAHRGYLVNLQHVKEVIPYTRNSFSLLLDDETEIPLSKGAARELRDLLGY
ncbi:MAG: LytTR family transcriptional regulator DNA-binding domain-containing protein [Anaerolineae bacterium]|nr:LytTR family transcriptional regulator DNA-binding domain-containing protein [Anaerolineae bacterium]